MLAVEQSLSDRYQFRRNVLNGKLEFAVKAAIEPGQAPLEDHELTFRPLTQQALNSIVLQARREDICEGKNPKSDIQEYINSEEVATFDPIAHFLSHLPQWDGQNHLARLFSRLPGVSSEQLAYLIIWLRSAVAHYWKPKNGNTMFVVCKCPDYVIWGLKKTPYLCTIEMKHSINNKKIDDYE